MSARVLLIKSRSMVSKNVGTSPPLGVMYLASYLRHHLDARVKILEPRFLADPVAEADKLMREFRPHLVGLSALTAETRLAERLAQRIKAAAPDLPVLLGGPHATVNTERAMRTPAMDVAVLGEGEETLLELTRLIMAEGSGWREPETLRAVRGIAFRGPAGKLELTDKRPPIQDLDALPFPAWDLIDLKQFGRVPGMASIGIRPYMSIFTSRGCPYRCLYCQHMFGRKFRARSVENVVAEIEEIRLRLGISEVEVVDDISNFDAGRLNQILEELLRRGLHTRFNFPNGVRTDLLRRETVELLRRVGVGEVSVAVETASPRLQRMLHKELDLDRVWQNIELMARHRILMRGFMMLGFPTETREELLTTISYACRSRLHLGLFFTVNPHPGTRLYQLFEEHGKLPPRVDSIDYEYYGAPFNGSEVSDQEFRHIYRMAYARFYSDPRRLYRIARDRGYYGDLPRRVVSLFRNNASFRRLHEET